MANRVAVIGTGQTKHESRRDDVSMQEMLREASQACLIDAGISVGQVEALVIGNMELFEGRALPEMWCAEGAGFSLKPSLKIATGGTSGTSAVIAGYYQVASGVFDVVMVVGFEKHSEGNTGTGMAFTDPMWDRHVASAAVGNFALSISQYMAHRGTTQQQAAMAAVKARRNACNNPYAHLQMPDLSVEDVLNSRMLAYPIHLLDMCPTTDGACAIILASEKVARKVCPKPAWIRAAATLHDQPYIGDHAERLVTMRTLKEASRRAYQAAGITDPLKQLDVAEIYDPVSYAELAWYEILGFCKPGEAGRLIEDGVTAMDGELPVNPSGGVLSTNPVGASGVIRVAEAALQIHGKGNKRQVPDVKTALATGYGVYSWADVVILSSSPQ